jgi:hypothetical protein
MVGRPPPGSKGPPGTPPKSRAGDASRRHNDLAGDLVRQLVQGTIGAGGDATETLVVMESVLVGTCLALVRLGGDEKVLDVLTDGARNRLAELRLKDVIPEGRA